MTESYFQILSGVLICGIALWTFRRSWGRVAVRGHAHDREPGGGEHAWPGPAGPAFQDPHEAAHADALSRRFRDGKVTTRQILVFGLTEGLVPCSAVITVLLVCLQLRKFALGVLLVLSFSVGLALTLVLSGVLAAVGVRQAARRLSGFDGLIRKAPYVSSALILLVGLHIGYQGLAALMH